MITSFILLLTIVLIALWNALIIEWKHELDPIKEKIINNNWHLVGFLIRILLNITLYLWSGWFLLWVGVIFSWHIYDIIINLIRGLPVFHTGKNFFDREPFCWIAKSAILLTGLLFLI